MTPRRYCLLKRKYYEQLSLWGLSGAWRAKQEQTEGEALPAGFPARLSLLSAGYSTLDDLDGATVSELLDYALLTHAQAQAVIAALW